MPETLAAAVGAGEPKATVEAATWPFPMDPTTYPPLTIRPGAGEAVWPATAKEIRKLIHNLYYHPTLEIDDQIEKAEVIRQRNISTKKETKNQHPGAIYTSRLMPNISKGKKHYYYFTYK